MTLTAEERIIVEDNMGLVGRVIKDKDHVPTGNFGYEDLFQIGCIGLCKAAATDKGGCFSTYAYRLIWNEICDALVRATRQSQYECCLDETIACSPQECQSVDQVSRTELQLMIQKARKQASGTTARGIECLELSAAGYKSAEIGRIMNASPSAVRMWMTKARRFLQAQPDLQDAYEEMMA